MKKRNVSEKERERGTAWSAVRGVKEWKCVSRDGKREQECAKKNRDEARERERERGTRDIERRRENRWAEARDNRRCE